MRRPSHSRSQGDACPFRHSEAAKATTSVCTSWTAGGCGNANCRYRHTGKTHAPPTYAPTYAPTYTPAQTPCRWEATPTGCLKPGCPFLHHHPRPAPPTFQPPVYSHPFAGQTIPPFVPSCMHPASIRRMLTHSSMLLQQMLFRASTRLLLLRISRFSHSKRYPFGR